MRAFGDAGVAASAEPDPAPPTQRAKNVPPRVFELEALDRPMPHLPEAVAIKVTVVSGIPGADEAFVETLKRSTLKPQPIPLCTMLRFELAMPPPPPPER